MGLGINKKRMTNAFDSGDEKKRLREFEKEFAEEKVFGLTGRPVKRSKRFLG